MSNSQPLRVFLCHSSGDKPAVRDLARRLRDDGFEPWLDEQALLPGQDWAYEIPKAVRLCQVFAVCLSPASIGKEGYLQKEIKYGLDLVDEKPEGTIFIIPVKLQECELPERLSRWQAANLYEANGYQRLIQVLRERARSIELKDHVAAPVGPRVQLRSEKATLTVNQAKVMIATRDFYCASWNESGKGIEHQYETRVFQDELLVVDHATGLAWQKTGSGNVVPSGENYIRDLNERKFAGFNDWRLPTLEEAMSLMVADKNGFSHLAPVFESRGAPFIVTSDSKSADDAWVVYFVEGMCNLEKTNYNSYVRAVRTCGF
jgi:hypothetical protein